MEHCEVSRIILDVYETCNIKNFPINCIDVIKKLKIPLYKYSELSEIKERECYKVSDDAFKLRGKIYYNDSFPYIRRQRFTLMHEVGHILLSHNGDTKENDDEANEFASHILAPRILIHKYDCRTVRHIYELFGLSYKASNRALSDYRKWYENIAQTTHRASESERQLELLFFPEKKACQKIEYEDYDEEYTPTPQEIYADIRRTLKAGLPLSSKYASLYRMYRKMGLK
ncbi:ImmA/IrrE family metallo-endopeptidase [Hungatella sp. L12]|uniref:ImmA/IrrE family metallo-endopeptidase n=1 Tax=Hungatella hominis TaxID=2763050 RepID=A0ABR7HAZ2_9FIRM|nr:ImmA/IrrE family metallo-endopeptidase [Hungatella hominis]MBC5710356.1 ImmA/IrrE family metallo-endopeptidase [Hungatella hominis]